MRISDWSSDVCSSDLAAEDRQQIILDAEALCLQAAQDAVEAQHGVERADALTDALHVLHQVVAHVLRMGEGEHDALVDRAVEVQRTLRSEEHTSELQSLMRNSYASFCLKKQNLLEHT